MNKLYSNNKTQAIDSLAAAYLGVESFELMQLAGAAVYQHMKHLNKLLVITGPGNNGGDGFVVAELARQQGQVVCVLALRAIDQLQGDARLAAEQYQGELLSIDELERIQQLEFDVVIDAIFGTGLKQTVSQTYADVINWLNQQSIPVISVDIPSGLNGSTGQVEGVAVRAVKTISILALNTGLYTLDGKDCCGEVLFESLGVTETVYQSIESDGELLNADLLQQLQLNRSHNSHKGRFGHVIAAGGQAGMLGAVLLAGRAILKSGAGSATIMTDSVHADLLPLHAPEIMSRGFDGNMGTPEVTDVVGEKSTDVLLLGMGLGQSAWSRQLFKSCLSANLPLVVDADGLTLLSRAAAVPAQLQVITPHPKEAAVLLNSTVAEIQSNRWQAVKLLAQKYQCVAVLKGSGTLICAGKQTWCCPYGSANLATAGSGDVLAGLIAGLMAQGYKAATAAQIGVLWHALVGENNRYGLSMTASDLLDTLHEVWL